MAALLPLFRHATRAAAGGPDAELLARFADGRDEDAFAELVRRHGPVVYRICRRLVGADAADDAFQAVFLVLATRLRAARAAASVGGWLVGVAGRVARQMRRAAYRRTRHETAAAGSRPAEGPEPAGELTDQFRVLDEELARLPDYLRDPVVLCFLLGRTQEEAAAELGRDARTLRRRLERAKRVLRARLERRGVVPAVAAALVGGAGSVCAAVPRDLAARAVATVFDFLTGGPAAAGSAPVVLAKGVATTMLTRKLICSVVAAAAGFVGLGVVLADDGPPLVVPSLGPAPIQLSGVKMPAQPPTAAPAQMPAAAARPRPELLDWQKDEALRRGLIAGMRQSLKTDERAVVIAATCIRVPASFCERSGLTAEESASGTWFLSQRETRMFTGLLRVEPGKDVLTCSTITALDGQTAVVEIGQQADVVTGLEAETKDGKTVYTARLSKVDLGVSLRVTPKVSPTGQVQLRIETETAELAGAGSPLAIPAVPADNTDGGKSGVVRLGHVGTNKQALQTTVVVPDAGTVVLRTDPASARGPKAAHETLWVLTPHIVRNDKKAAAPAVAPPVPTPPRAAPPVVEPPARP